MHPPVEMAEESPTAVRWVSTSNTLDGLNPAPVAEARGKKQTDSLKNATGRLGGGVLFSVYCAVDPSR